MSTIKIQQYNIQQKAKNVAETPWLILPGENKLTRRLVKIKFIRDYKNPKKFVGLHLETLFQKRSSTKNNWPSKTIDLRRIPNDFGFKFNLDSHQTKELSEALNDAFPIGADAISSGKRTVIRGVDSSVIITEKNKTALLKQLSNALNEKDINDWLSANLPLLSQNLAIARIYQEHKQTIKEFNDSLTNFTKSEHYWKDFLKRNQWVFGASYVNIIDEQRIDIHHETDLPFEIEDGFMDIVEIKRPDSPFWAQHPRSKENYLYRGKFLIPHLYLQGAISQLSKYIFQAEKKVSDVDYIVDHGGVAPIKPRGLIVHGRSFGWRNGEKESFRLLNDGLHNIQIITFDHLLARAKRILKVMEIEAESDNPDSEEILDVSDIPF